VITQHALVSVCGNNVVPDGRWAIADLCPTIVAMFRHHAALPPMAVALSACAEKWMKRIESLDDLHSSSRLYTPIALLALPPRIGMQVADDCVCGGGRGVTLKMLWSVGAPAGRVPLYYYSANVAIWFRQAASRRRRVVALVLLVAGPCSTTVGAVLYVFLLAQNPWPRTFGYHELLC